MIILSTRMARIALGILALATIMAIATIEPLEIKEQVEADAAKLQNYMARDLRHLSSIQGCLSLSGMDDAFGDLYARECVLRLLEFKQPYHSLLSLAALAHKSLNDYPNDHVLRTKMLMAIAVTRAYEKRMTEEVFQGYYKTRSMCLDSWFALEVFRCERWFDRPVVRNSSQVMSDLDALEKQFAHHDLDDLLSGVALVSQRRELQALADAHIVKTDIVASSTGVAEDLATSDGGDDE